MIKVLHILSALDGGGVESMIKSYYEQIENEDILFDFLVHGTKIGMLEKFFSERGCKIYHIPAKKKNIFKHVYQLKRIFKNNNYDIVHCHQGDKGYLALKYAKKIAKAKCICHAHGNFQYKSFFKKALHKLRLNNVVRYTDAYCACSQEAAISTFGKQLCEKYFVQIVNNAFSVGKFQFNDKYRQEIRSANNIKEGDFLLGMVGRLSSEKNHAFAFDVLNCMQDPRVKMMLVGEGPLYNNLIEYCKINNLEERIIFVGKVQDVWKYYSAFDAFLFPSKFEGLGIALVEAQICGLPCIISENISKDAIVNKGFVQVLELLLEKWVKELKMLKNLSYSRDIDIKTFKNFDIKVQYDKLLKLYWRLIR